MQWPCNFNKTQAQNPFRVKEVKTHDCGLSDNVVAYSTDTLA